MFCQDLFITPHPRQLRLVPSATLRAGIVQLDGHDLRPHRIPLSYLRLTQLPQPHYQLGSPHVSRTTRIPCTRRTLSTTGLHLHLRFSLA